MEEAVITRFLRFVITKAEENNEERMNYIDCSPVLTDTFVDENEEHSALYTRTEVNKSVDGEELM